MSLKPTPIDPVPEGTARVARAAFRAGWAMAFAKGSSRNPGCWAPGVPNGAAAG